jgi:G3E family GTPase
MEMKIRQIAFSDLVILNKRDLVNMTQIAEIKDWLASRMHRSWLVEANHCDVPLEILLSVGRFDPAQIDLQG